MRSRSSSHRSSFSHSSMHRSSLSHNSMHKRMSGIASMHSNAFRRHGISNAHAFAVGKATGVNINGSSMGAHGAALHRSRKIRTGNHFIGNRKYGTSSVFSRKNSFYNRYKSSSDFFERMRVSHTKHRYTSKKTDYSRMQKMGEEVNNVMNKAIKFAWIPFLIFFILFFIIVLIFTAIFFLMIMKNMILLK